MHITRVNRSPKENNLPLGQSYLNSYNKIALALWLNLVSFRIPFTQNAI